MYMRAYNIITTDRRVYLKPAVRTKLALLREPLAVARSDETEVGVVDHLDEAGLGSCELIGEAIQFPPQAVRCTCVQVGECDRDYRNS